jgi:hypothetical protein
VTHEEVHPLLGSYAAGTLEGDVSSAVRAHLATGCLECFRDVFGRPVGLPRAAAVASVGSAPRVESRATAKTRRAGLVAAVVVLGLAAGSGVAWTIGGLRRATAAARADALSLSARAAETDAARLRLARRAEMLEEQLAAAREDLTRHASLARDTGDDRGRLADELDVTRERLASATRELRRRATALSRLRLGLDGVGAVHELLATPDAALLRLRPVPPFRDVRGHVLADPGRGTLAVFAFGLPPPPTGGRYGVRVTLDDGRDLPPHALAPDGEPTAVHLDVPAAHVESLDVVLDPSSRRLLSWRRE